MTLCPGVAFSLYVDLGLLRPEACVGGFSAGLAPSSNNFFLSSMSYL